MWRQLLLAHAAAVRAIEGDLDRAGQIPLSWYDVLLELDAAEEGRLRMQDLAALVTLSRSRVSRVVGELEQADLVERTSDPRDGRATFASITAAGRRSLRKAMPIYLDAIGRHVTSHLTSVDVAATRRAMRKVVQAHSLVPPPRRRR